jgi:hypothetical protein
VTCPPNIDRRTTLKWVLAASAAVPLLKAMSPDAAAALSRALPDAKGYGLDPDLQKVYAPGELWPLTLTPQTRRTATALCDLIIPADDGSPSASSVGVVDFIDEWISAPYPQQRGDREIILPGLEWLGAESQKRFGKAFAALDDQQKSAIADDICSPARAKPEFAKAAKFFSKFRDLTAGGFYTTPVGMKDLQYVGNVPLPSFDGPPRAVLEAVGLA